MKKYFGLLLIAILSIMLFGCGETPQESTAPETTPVETTEEKTEETMETTEAAQEPILEERLTEAPNYALKEDTTTEELRATAVRAMYDLVTVPWYSRYGWQYSKSGVGSGKVWTYGAKLIFGGLPYTNGSSGLFHWLTLYNYENGELSDFDTELLNDTLGNSCYSAVTWAWASVTNDISWKTTHEMTPVNGCPIVGDYDIGQAVDSYKDNPTDEICKANGEQKMFEAYAKVLPADGMLYIPAGDGNHIRMASEAAVVVRNADGTINGDESYILYHDQAMGHANVNNKFVIDGKERWLAGHINTKLTFKEWFNAGYIPITATIFTGAKAYEVPNVKVEGAEECTTVSEFKNVKLTSVLRMAWVKCTAYDEGGKKVGEALHLINREETETMKLCYNAKLSQFFKQADLKKAGLEKGATYRMVIETQDASGNYYTILDKNIEF